jgi:hypothetical protein
MNIMSVQNSDIQVFQQDIKEHIVGDKLYECHVYH